MVLLDQSWTLVGLCSHIGGFDGICMFIFNTLEVEDLEWFCGLSWAVWKNQNASVHNESVKTCDEV